MSDVPEPLERREFETQRLLIERPPVWRNANKQVVYGIACPAGSTHAGRLSYTRWATMPLRETIDVHATLRRVEMRPGFYDYSPVQGGPGSVEWHVNFADPFLFVAYGSGLFAQDEMQVAEHPSLGALKEALAAAAATALTVETGRPTPILVAGVERHCKVATDSNAGEGRPVGLYGNAFARASQEAVRRATTRLNPPTISNIIAIAAPTGSEPYTREPYTREQIEYILEAAASGFGAAVIESAQHSGRRAEVAVHTGFWGCGAFGGNRVLMMMLQIAAAGCAELDRLVFHTGDAGTQAFDEARRTLVSLRTGTCPTTRLIDAVVGLGLTWGVSDGN